MSVYIFILVVFAVVSLGGYVLVKKIRTAFLVRKLQILLADANKTIADATEKGNVQRVETATEHHNSRVRAGADIFKSLERMIEDIKN